VSAVISASGLTKSFGSTRALDGVSFEVGEGRIVGLIGPNGAGKTTALKAILGLTSFHGDLNVLGHDPRKDRARLMREVCFIADVAVLPRWLKVNQALDFVEAVHPGFQRSRAEAFLAKTNIDSRAKVKALSKGMVTQLHLALVMAIDAKLLVLDEPTIGLDIIYRKDFYTTLLNAYFDERRTILVTTHQVEEIENILTDLLFIDRGRIVLQSTMEDVANDYVEVMVKPEKADAARQYTPVYEREVFGKSVFLFKGVESQALRPLGELRTPSVADLFVAKVKGMAA